MVQVSQSIINSNIMYSHDKFNLWIHDHPLTIKIIEIAALLLGIGLLAATPIINSITFTILSKSIVLGLTNAAGTIAIAIAGFVNIVLGAKVGPHHDMKNHVYKTAECEGGKLFYDGDVPILTLDADNPHVAGNAHGYLCGAAINQLIKQYHFYLHTLGGRPTADQILPQQLEEIRKTIPTEYIKEMEGLLEGYNKWAKENWWLFPKMMTFNDILHLHLIPDSLHFQPKTLKDKVYANNDVPILGCTAIVNKRSGENLEVARNMDWPSFKIAGTKSLVINRKFTDHRRNTVEVNFPGLCGTATGGLNDSGLSIFMNVCSGNTKNITGMPACFYNRYCLENFNSVRQVENHARKHSPLGPYHLTVADASNGSSIHFYQSPDKRHVVRRLESKKPLVTLNYRYAPAPSSDMHESEKRQQIIDQFLKSQVPIEDALALPYVNNTLTTHRIAATPKTRSFRVAFDNAFAGKEPLHNVSTEALFKRKSDISFFRRLTTDFLRLFPWAY